MIFVDRNAVPKPRILEERWPVELSKAKAFYARPPEERRQERFASFAVYKEREVRDALETLFHRKCAYCETRTSAGAFLDIDQYRPKGGVVLADGKHLPDHYWWLAGEWSNLYPVCAHCNRKSHHSIVGEERVRITSGKGNRFPLADETLRAPVLATGSRLDDEEPLLLDPCRDDPEEHLVYGDDGTVVSETSRGRTTILVLGLNRVALVEERLAHLGRILAEVEDLGRWLALMADTRVGSEALMKFRQLSRYLDADQPYAGMTRQVLGALLPELREKLNELSMQRSTQEFQRVVTKHVGRFISKHEQRRIQQNFAAHQRRQEDYSLESETKADLERYRSQPRHVERIDLRNLKGVSQIRFDVASAGPGSWLMLLGENGVGKSTVLQATSLALLGEKYFRRVWQGSGIDPAGLVRHGADFGEVKVLTSGASQPRVVRFFRDGRVEFQGPPGGQALVLAYGSTRLLPRSGAKDSRDEEYRYARVENLFDPFIPLLDAETWLVNLDAATFDFAARMFKDLLDLGASARFITEGERVLVESGRRTVHLQQLSDGFQTVVALYADILEVLLRLWPTPESAEGIVLIDEVGSHLHPAWKMRFVSDMRRVLPRLQVIATTHDPLCLRGLVDGEIAVLRRGPRGGISKVPELPSIEGLRVDQILTSQHFGLESTIDPAYQNRIDTYYRLLRKTRPSDTDRRRIKELRREINREQRLGKSERERMLLQAIDEHLAAERSLRTRRQAEELSATTRAKLAEIWRSVRERE